MIARLLNLEEKNPEMLGSDIFADGWALGSCTPPPPPHTQPRHLKSAFEGRIDKASFCVASLQLTIETRIKVISNVFLTL